MTSCKDLRVLIPRLSQSIVNRYSVSFDYFYLKVFFLLLFLGKI
jgi:hypothetical protein